MNYYCTASPNYLGPKTTKMKNEITYTQAQRIIDNISRCCEWSDRLAKLWGPAIALKSKDIPVPDHLLKEGRAAANSEQNVLLDEIFERAGAI